MAGIKITPPNGGFRPSVARRKNAPRCRACRYFTPNWCLVSAQRVPSDAEMCEYGRRSHASEMAMRAAKKTKQQELL